MRECVDVRHEDGDAGAVCDEHEGKRNDEGGGDVLDNERHVGVEVFGAAGRGGKIAEFLVRGEFVAAEFDGDGRFGGTVDFAGVEFGGAAAEPGRGVENPGVGGGGAARKHGKVLLNRGRIGGPLDLKRVAFERDEGRDVEVERSGAAEAGRGGGVEVGDECGNAGYRDAVLGRVDARPLVGGEAAGGGVHGLALGAEHRCHYKRAVAAGGHAEMCELHGVRRCGTASVYIKCGLFGRRAYAAARS